MSVITRDFWLTNRETPRLDRLKESLTLAAATANSGFPAGSLSLTNGTALFYHNVAAATLTNTTCTLEFSYKIDNPISVSGTRGMVFISTNTQIKLSLSINFANDTFVIKAFDSVPTTVTFATGVSVSYGTWHHYAISRTISGGTTTIKFYIDGVLVFTGTDGTLNNGNTAAPWGVYVGDQPSSSVYVSGAIANLRVWTVVRTDGEIDYGKDKWLGDSDSSTYLYPTLPESFFMSYVAGATSVPNHGYEVVTEFGPFGVSPIVLNSTDYPTLKFGASFAAIQWDIVLTNHVSIKWPVDMPDDTTGMLVVRWTDDDGVVQRRKLWDMDGVDIHPAPTAYTGERLPLSFTLELYNIDGHATVALPTACTIYVSICTNPTTSYDESHQLAYAPNGDTTLAASFPLVFPVVFNTQQNYA